MQKVSKNYQKAFFLGGGGSSYLHPSCSGDTHPMPHSKDLAETTWADFHRNLEHAVVYLDVFWTNSREIELVKMDHFHSNFGVKIKQCLKPPPIQVSSWGRCLCLEHVNVQYRFTRLAAVRLAELRKHKWCSRIFSCLQKENSSLFWCFHATSQTKMYQLSFHMLPIEILDMFIHQNPLVTSVSSTWSLTHLDPRAWERHKIFPNVVTDQDTKVRSEYPAETKRGGIFMVEEIISTSFHTYTYIYTC